MKNRTRLTFKIYWDHVKKRGIYIFVVLFFIILASIVNVVIPLFFKHFFDILSSEQNDTTILALLYTTLMWVAGLELLQWVFWRIGIWAMIHVQIRTMTELANTCFAYLHKHSFSYFNNNFVGSLVKRVGRFIASFENMMDKLAYDILQLIVNIVVITIVLFTRDTFLGIITIVWIIIFMAVNWAMTGYKLKYDIKESEAETYTTRVLADTITNNVNVKLFNGYNREIVLYSDTNNSLERIRRFTWNLEGIYEAVQGFLMIILEIGALYIGIQLWSKGMFTIGDFVLLQSYLLIVFMKIWNFGRVVRSIYKDLANAEEMTEIFDTPHEIVDVHNAKALVVTDGVIVFDNVDFAYNQTRKVINKLNLTIPSYQKIAFVGPSGAGKSTLVKLLLRQHDVSRGKICIDSQKISHVTQDSLWQNISLVPQDPILFHRTLMENIRYGKPDATDEEVIQASKQAHCHEFISGFPEQYGTYVGERGVKLSGGERQRVAIARAILRNAPILVLDEATSSLDSESEKMIQDALDILMKGKTVIVIAHRLSTIMRMDRIVVIDSGNVLEDGTHKQLLRKKNGLYKHLWKLQAGGFID